ncbi:MAG: metal ABC transporter solute-binding protein, Zn/Mn family [Nitrososphaeraceae archaeon]
MNINNLFIFALITIGLVVIAKTEYSYQSEQNISEQMNNLTQPKLKISTSFFPYYDVVSQIVGDKAELKSVIPFGSEPHDWEPLPSSIKLIQESDIIVYNGVGFDSWIEDILSESNGNNNTISIDISDGLKLLELSEDEHHDEHKEYSGYDPHVWLDPILMKAQAELINKSISKLDPINSKYYSNNTVVLLDKLDSLDQYAKTSFSNCKLDEFIPFHDAYSYFTERYNLTAHPIHGLAPEGEILPQNIEQVINITNELGITTLFSEDLVDPRLINTLAQEIPNSQVLLLSPLEGILPEEYDNGIGYLEKMKQNVDNLKIGLKCS